MEFTAENENPFLQIWQVWKVPIIVGILSLILIATSVILLIKSTQTTAPIEFSSDKIINQASDSAKQNSLIAVDVEGAVVNPGLYQLPSGSRVEEAIIAAGGLSEEADEVKISKSINRAAKLVDGAKLYFPKIGEKESIGDLGNPSNLGDLANINSASKSELEALPGIGPVTAQKIIDGRPYQTLEELVSRKVVGSSLFEKIKEKLTL